MAERVQSPLFSAERQRMFCEALHRVVAHRRGLWWTSINSVADHLGIDYDEAAVLAHECEKAGWLRHDLSSSATKYRHGHAVPRSVILSAAGLTMLRDGPRSNPSPSERRRASATGGGNPGKRSPGRQ
jgi:hypothetical protein